MSGILLLGFLIGMSHALEADHIAAVASLSTRSRSARQTLLQGAFWGAGHTLTLLLVGLTVLLLDTLVPPRFAQGLELAVGLMLVGLGADVLWRLVRDRVHFHLHHHGAVRHLHVHSHRGGLEHASDPHRHEHPRAPGLRALLVGMMHGLAGSAALIVLALESAESLAQGLVYILLFGLGSMAGMVLLAGAVSIPLRLSASLLTRAHNGLQALVGLATLGIGAALLYRVAVVDGLLV